MSNPMVEPSPRRTRLLAGLVLLAVFLAGGLLGAAVEHWRSARFPGFPGGPPPMPFFMDALGLSDEQGRQIEAIMNRHHPQMETLMQEVFPRMKSLTDAMEAEINAVLTPQQREKAEKMRRKFVPGPPPPGHLPPAPLPFPPPPGRSGPFPPANNGQPVSRPAPAPSPASSPASENTTTIFYGFPSSNVEA